MSAVSSGARTLQRHEFDRGESIPARLIDSLSTCSSRRSPPMSVSATARTFDSEVLASEEPVLVDFWAPWCSPCRAVAPVVERLAQQHDLKLVKVNYDEEPEIAERFGIMAIPNIVLFRNGAPAAQAIGARPQKALEIALGLSR